MRAQVSLELDHELSQLERAMVKAHVSRCGECRAYRADLRAFTRELRASPLVRPEAPVSVRRSRRMPATVARLQVGIAAAMALAAVGIAGQLAAYRPSQSTLRGTRVVHYQSDRELQHELALIGRATSQAQTHTSGAPLTR